MSEVTRQVLEVDVLFVGAGSASLAGALHLKKLTVYVGHKVKTDLLLVELDMGPLQEANQSLQRS